ncbi:HNH endonuclease [compost metagenome]
MPGKQSAHVRGFSDLLIELGRRTGVAMTPKFRNPNGVYMKMMNFRRLDPAFTAQGKSGLKRGSDLERRVWEAYDGGRDLLKAHADALRYAIGDVAISLTITMEDEAEYEGEEGGVLLKLHRSRERDSKLVRRKRAEVLERTGALACEVCSLDFGDRYGELGEGYIEVHHLKPVASLGGRGKTKLSDLAVVCANCHRMLHRGRRLRALEDLRSAMSGAA